MSPKRLSFCNELNVVNVECMDFWEFQRAKNNLAEFYPSLYSFHSSDICESVTRVSEGELAVKITVKVSHQLVKSEQNIY